MSSTGYCCPVSNKLSLIEQVSRDIELSMLIKFISFSIGWFIRVTF